MKNLRNNVILIGHLGKAPEVKTLPSGSVVANFPLATNENYNNAKGDKVENTQWHNCVAWGKTAETLNKWVKKGDKIATQGKISYRKYEDKNGQVKYVTEIVINEFEMLTSKETEK